MKKENTYKNSSYELKKYFHKERRQCLKSGTILNK